MPYTYLYPKVPIHPYTTPTPIYYRIPYRDGMVLGGSVGKGVVGGKGVGVYRYRGPIVP